MYNIIPEYRGLGPLTVRSGCVHLEDHQTGQSLVYLPVNSQHDLIRILIHNTHIYKIKLNSDLYTSTKHKKYASWYQSSFFNKLRDNFNKDICMYRYSYMLYQYFLKQSIFQQQRMYINM